MGTVQHAAERVTTHSCGQSGIQYLWAVIVVLYVYRVLRIIPIWRLHCHGGEPTSGGRTVEKRWKPGSVRQKA